MHRIKPLVLIVVWTIFCLLTTVEVAYGEEELVSNSDRMVVFEIFTRST